MRYLAIDYGKKNTGLAICDYTETIVSPLVVIPNAKDLFTKILDVVRMQSVEAIVVGLPMNMDDSIGPQAKIVQEFAEKLKKFISVPIYLQDERLTTFAAQEKLSSRPDSGFVTRKLTRKKKKQRLDALAAAEILQAFLESNRS
jgi:putative Holliday junction resolvase